MCKVVVFLNKPFAFLPFLLSSSLSLLKLPIVVIQKFCYHGYVLAEIFVEGSFLSLVAASEMKGNKRRKVCYDFISSIDQTGK